MNADDADDALMQFHHNARDLFNQGELRLAEGHFGMLKEALEGHHREFTIFYSSTISYLAKIYHETGRLQEALPLMERALETDEMQLGPDNKLLSFRHGNLGLLLGSLKRYPEAERHLLRALHIAKENFGLTGEATAVIREHLRTLRKEMKNNLPTD